MQRRKIFDSIFLFNLDEENWKQLLDIFYAKSFNKILISHTVGGVTVKINRCEMPPLTKNTNTCKK